MSERLLKGWYSSQVVLPEENNEIIWLNSDGREAFGTYDQQGNWYAADGQRLWYAPLFWRYANEDNPDTRRDDTFSRWMESHSWSRPVNRDDKM